MIDVALHMEEVGVRLTGNVAFVVDIVVDHTYSTHN